jgi:hypothetical protein
MAGESQDLPDHVALVEGLHPLDIAKYPLHMEISFFQPLEKSSSRDSGDSPKTLSDQTSKINSEKRGQ